MIGNLFKELNLHVPLTPLCNQARIRNKETWPGRYQFIPSPILSVLPKGSSRHSDLELHAETISFLPLCRKSLVSWQRSDIHEPSWVSSWRLTLLEKPARKPAEPVKKPKLGVSSHDSDLCLLPFGRFSFAATTDGLPSQLRLLWPLLWYMQQLELLSECQRECLIGYCLRVFLRWKWLT